MSSPYLPDPSNPTTWSGPLGLDYQMFRNHGKGLKLQAATLTANRVITLPDANGTVALLNTTPQTFTGALTFSATITFSSSGAVIFQGVTTLNKPLLRVSAAAVAAGSTTTDATALGTANAAFVVSAADGTKGVRLTAIGVDAELKVINNAASALKVYPPTGGTLNGGAADAPITVSANRSALLQQITTTAWTALFN